MEMLRVDLFIQIVELLPPAFLNRQASHCVSVKYDEHWHNSQSEDWGRQCFQITFYQSDDQESWEFRLGENRYPVDLIIDTIRRLPSLRTVPTDFINMYVTDRLVAAVPPPEAVEDTIPLRTAMFHKAYFDNPNGGRPCVDWAIRIGKREIND